MDIWTVQRIWLTSVVIKGAEARKNNEQKTIVLVPPKPFVRIV